MENKKQYRPRMTNEEKVDEIDSILEKGESSPEELIRLRARLYRIKDDNLSNEYSLKKYEILQCLRDMIKEDKAWEESKKNFPKGNITIMVIDGGFDTLRGLTPDKVKGILCGDIFMVAIGNKDENGLIQSQIATSDRVKYEDLCRQYITLGSYIHKRFLEEKGVIEQ